MLAPAGLGQTPNPQSAAAWWAQASNVDRTVGRAAKAALSDALSAESDAERQLSNESLSTRLVGAELTREQQLLAELQKHQTWPWSIDLRYPVIVGGDQSTVVLYVHSIREWDAPDTATDPDRLIEESDGAYRMVLLDGSWLLADAGCSNGTRDASARQPSNRCKRPTN